MSKRKENKKKGGPVQIQLPNEADTGGQLGEERPEDLGGAGQRGGAAKQGEGGDQPADKNHQNGFSFSKVAGWIKGHWPECIAMPGAIVSGVLAFRGVFDQWWFGFRVSAWVLIFLGIALNIIWLVAFWKYLSDRKEDKVRLSSWNTLLMIGLPVLVLGIWVGVRVTQKRFEENVVILVEPFEGEKEGDGDIAKIVKREIESAIPSWLSKLHRVKVVLGTGVVKDGSREVPLSERALKYQADMIISGWYSRGESGTLVCANFYVHRVPQALAGVFRGRENGYPRTFVFSEKEVENFTVHFTVGKLLGHECILILGAGAYASRQWEEAQHYFTEAQEKIKEMEEGSNFPKRELKGYLKGDKATLELYLGHCLINQGQLVPAIEHYHAAVKLGRDVPRTDPRYDEIQVNAYMGRAMAYREKNEFALAAHDFQTLGDYGLLSEERKVFAADERRGSYICMARLEGRGKAFYNRGNKYLKDEMLVHAEAELKISVDVLEQLRRSPLVREDRRKCERLLAESLVRFGEVHSRLALPELQNDKHTEEAIKHLSEALEMIKELKRKIKVEADPNLYKLHAECLRHLGDVRRATDRVGEVNRAKKHHEDANDFWTKFAELTEAAGEQTRIGNAYRRLDDLDPNSGKAYLKEAVDAYSRAVKKLEGTEYLEALDTKSTDRKHNIKTAEKELLDDSKENIRTHHLANALSNLAETHIKLYLRDQNDSNDPNVPNKRHIRIGCKVLKYAAECYEVAVEKLDTDPNWNKQIREEERNRSLEDDLAWCRTLRGFALIEQGVPEVSDSNKYYKEVIEILTKAKRYFSEQRLADQGHLVLNLFTLTVAQVKVGEEEKARKTFLEACELLRELTRKEKKIWYVDYVCDIIGKLPKRFKCNAGIAQVNLKKLEDWLEDTRVREGRRALDEIIKGM